MTTNTAGLNLVLLGKTGAGKSASGNTILGRQAFISKKSSKSITQDVAVESGAFCELPVHVYDTPGFFDTEVKEQEIKLNYQNLFQRCESGPCAFLLVIKADRFTQEERKTVEKIEELLGPKRLEKTWILFTRGDELQEENITMQEFLNDSEPLKKLVQKYDQRFHIFNNKTEDCEQVKMLFVKIIRTHLDASVVEADPLKQNPLKRKTPVNAEPLTPDSSLSSRRIVLLGKTGVGKSASGNTILGQTEFKSVMSMSSVTSESLAAHAHVSGGSVSVVDTPGLFDTKMNPEELAVKIAESIYISSPGPHAFLIVFPVNMRFTEHEQQIPQKIEMMFGQDVLKYSIVLFTHGDLLEKSIEELIEENCTLRGLVHQCGGRYHVFHNKDQNNREQVNNLLQKIDTMIEQNGGGHYSNQMYEDALRFRQEEEKRRQKEEEERKQQMEKQIQEEIERAMKETEERTREEMKAEQKRVSDEEQRKQEKIIQEEIKRVRKETEERIRAEMQAKLKKNEAENKADESKTGFIQFCSKYWHYILIGGFVVGIGGVVIGALVGAAVGALVGAAVGGVVGAAAVGGGIGALVD